MKEIIKDHGGGILIVLVFIFSVAGLIGYNLYNINQAEERMSKNLGKSVVMGSDTLEIVDYSIWNNSYTLQDGRSINGNYAKILERQD